MKVTQKSERLSMPETYKLKRFIYRVRQRCNWCQVPLALAEATLDHLTPLSRGGSNALENLTLACDNCNQLRNMQDMMGKRFPPLEPHHQPGKRRKYRNGRIKHKKHKNPVDPMHSHAAKNLLDHFRKIKPVDTQSEK